MAVTTWSPGQVLAAQDLNDTFASKADYPSGGSDGDVLLKSGTGTAWGTSFPNNATAEVTTQQTTTSTSYTDLSTAGPNVTVTTGTKALVTVGVTMYNSLTNLTLVSFAVSGATTIAAADKYAVVLGGSSNSVVLGASQTYLLTGLTAGSNTFTVKYRVTGGTATIYNRYINVVDMGS